MHIVNDNRVVLQDIRTFLRKRILFKNIPPCPTEAHRDSRQRLLILMTIYSLGKGYPMILFGKKHLHVSESDQIVDSLLKFLKVTSGSVKRRSSNSTRIEN